MKINWPEEKLDEIYTVKRFLENAGIKFQFTQQNFILSPEEPVDVFVKDINKKFQVVVADFQHYEILGKTKAINGVKFIELPARKIEDVIREYIIKPIKKKSKYRKAAKGVILLLNSPFDPPWVEKQLEIQRKLGFNRILKKIGFDEIHIVCPKKNIKVYP